MSIPKVLTIAGSDPSGGAGIQADLKTFSALKVYGMAAISALTAQNTQGVQGVYGVPPKFFEKQLRSVFDDIPPDAVKIGMLGNIENVATLIKILQEYKPANVVLDPVMVASSGDALIDKDALALLKAELIPLADLITPNKEEMLNLGCESARDLTKLGSKAVLLTGGHSKDLMCVDILAGSLGAKAYEGRRSLTRNTHGTGCTFSAAIAAELAKGKDLLKAVGAAKKYITQAVAHADELEVGEGRGPVHHFWELWASEEEEQKA
jgi:hydroxymethylpyrimidine kinase/phosphomethylpyrimidine kinase